MTLIRQLARSMRLLVARGLVRLVNDAGGLQVVQVELLAGETRELMRAQNYGATGVPPENSEAIAVAVGGKRSHLILVAIDDPASRPRNLAVGEYCIYTKFGDRIHLRDDRVIAVTAGTRIEVDAPLAVFLHDFEIMGGLTVHGTTTLQDNLVQAAGNISTAGDVSSTNVTATAAVTAAGISLGAHIHGGVATGSGTTGVPQ